MNNFTKLALFSLLLANQYLNASDGFDDDFDSSDDIKIVKTNIKKESNLSYYGVLKQNISYNYNSFKSNNIINNDYRGFSSFKTSLNLNVDYKINDNNKIKSTSSIYKDFIYTLKKDSYNTTPDTYDYEFNINELYLQSKISSKIDFTIGRALITWGKSDNIVITDIINPLDNRTPGMVDIKDLKLARLMSKIDYYINSSWDISFAILHENRFSKNPKFGSDYAPQNLQIANSLNIKEPTNSIKNTGFALSLNGNLQGQDLSFYALNDYVNNTNYKSNMLGFAYNKVLDSFLLTAELAYINNYDTNTKADITNSLIGLTYKGISEGSISLEIANKDKQTQYALRFAQSYFNNTLDYTFLYKAFAKDLSDGGIVRTWFDYSINDKLSSSFGLINYIGGSNKFDLIKNNDRVFASIEYSF